MYSSKWLATPCILNVRVNYNLEYTLEPEGEGKRKCQEEFEKERRPEQEGRLEKKGMSTWLFYG